MTQGENDKNVLYITGGVALNSGHSRTFLAFTIDTEIFKEMSPLIESRSAHGCHLYEREDSQRLIVAGGVTTGWKRVVSAEVYDFSWPGQGWKSVTPLEDPSEGKWKFFSFNAMNFMALLVESKELVRYDLEKDQWLKEVFPNNTVLNIPAGDIIPLNIDKVKACTPK